MWQWRLKISCEATKPWHSQISKYFFKKATCGWRQSIFTLELSDSIAPLVLQSGQTGYYWPFVITKQVFFQKRQGLPRWLSGKEPICQCRRPKRQGFNPLEEGMATHSSILAWEIGWTEEPSGLQSIGLQRVRHVWSDLAHTHALVENSRPVPPIPRVSGCAGAARGHGWARSWKRGKSPGSPPGLLWCHLGGAVGGAWGPEGGSLCPH